MRLFPHARPRRDCRLCRKVLLLTIGAAGLLARVAAARQQAAATRPVGARYWLRVTGDRVNLRSRADLNSRIVGRVDHDDVLEAVGQEHGWHRIIPPPGVYSLVAAQYIERVGPDRGVVRVETSLRVRVGSDIQPRDPMVSEVQTRLPPGAEVRILGELDGWLKIVPPPGVCVYVTAEYVTPIDAATAERLRAARAAAATRSAARPATAPAPKPTTRPADRWSRALEQVLTAVRAEQRKPAEAQHWAELLARLRSIAEQQEEPAAAREAAGWIARIERRSQARPEPSPTQRAAEAEADRRRFDACGVLQPCFALPLGPYGLRYSLQDPFTRAVRAYVELPTELGIDLRDCVGRYVGVRGRPVAIEGLDRPLLRVSAMTVLREPGTRPAP